MSTSSARVEANRANAQQSTGPRTPEGKLRSSVNSLRHGLTSKMVLLPEDDLVAYEKFKRSFFDQVKPKGELEEQLAFTLVNTQWRLNRCRFFEESILATRTCEPSDPEANTRLVHGQVESLARLSLYESRLTRIFQTTLKQLREIQAERSQLEERAMADAAKVLKECQTKQMPFDPGSLGFVFSSSEIETWLSRHERIQAARDHDAIAFNSRFFPQAAARAGSQPAKS